MFFIPEPDIDDQPVSVWRWALWHIGYRMKRIGIWFQYWAEDRCDQCGKLRKGRDHSACDGIPF